jgi:hypothetical protein
VAAAAVAVFYLLGIAGTRESSGGDLGSEAGPVAISGPGTTAGVKTEEPAVPGSKITLRLDQAVKPGSRYLWLQTMGPPINVGERTGPELKLTVPLGADALGFLLIVADDQGIRTSQVDVPIVPADPQLSASRPTQGVASAAPWADAGDDQIGLVGRQITLNGSASRPQNGLAYRWIQVGGPEIRSPADNGSFFSFVPSSAGVYRFALVVARQEQISPPDYVTVTVGLLPGLAAPAPGLAPVATGDELDAIVSASMASIDDATGLAPQLADVFSTASFRMDLYQTYADLYTELSRRLDAILPQDPSRRARWSAALFEPLTRILIVRMLPLGVDLRSPAGQAAPLTAAQKTELRSQFDRTARLLRSVRAGR